MGKSPMRGDTRAFEEEHRTESTFTYRLEGGPGPFSASDISKKIVAGVGINAAR